MVEKELRQIHYKTILLIDALLLLRLCSAGKKSTLLFGPARTPGAKGPRSRDLTGQDLETLKVPWSWQDRT